MTDKKPVPPSLAEFALEQLAEAGEQAAIDLTVQNVEILRDEIERRDARIVEQAREIDRLRRSAQTNWNEFADGMKAQPSAGVVDGGEARHDVVKALHDVMEAVPCSSLYSMAEAVLDAGYSLNPCRAQSVPEGYVMVPVEQARSCVTCSGFGIIGHSTLCPECAAAQSAQQKESE